MKMPSTTAILSSLPPSPPVLAAREEVAVAQELRAMLQALVDAHWREAPHETVRSLVRQADALLGKIGG